SESSNSCGRTRGKTVETGRKERAKHRGEKPLTGVVPAPRLPLFETRAHWRDATKTARPSLPSTGRVAEHVVRSQVGCGRDVRDEPPEASAQTPAHVAPPGRFAATLPVEGRDG